MDTKLDSVQKVVSNLNESASTLIKKGKDNNADLGFIIESLKQAESLINETKEIIKTIDAEKDKESYEKACNDLATYQALYDDYYHDLREIILGKEDFIDSDKDLVKTVSGYYYLVNALNANSPVAWITKIIELRKQIKEKFMKITGRDNILVDDGALPLDIESFQKNIYPGNDSFVENEKIEIEYRKYLKDFFENKVDRYKVKLIQDMNLNIVMHTVNNGYHDEEALGDDYPEEVDLSIPEREEEAEKNPYDIFVPISNDELNEDEEYRTVYSDNNGQLLTTPFPMPVMVEKPEYVEENVPTVGENNESEIVYETAPVVQEEAKDVSPWDDSADNKDDLLEPLDLDGDEDKREIDKFNSVDYPEEEANAFFVEMSNKVARGEFLDQGTIDKYHYYCDLKNKKEHSREAKTMVIGSLSDVFGPREDKEKSSKRTFKFIKKSSDKIKEFINKNKKILLVASFVAVSALSFVAGKNLSNKRVFEVNKDQKEVTSFVDNSEEPIISIHSESDYNNRFIYEPTSDDIDISVNVNNNSGSVISIENENHVMIGDTFTLKPDATIYSDEYVQGKGLHPYYGKDVERSVRFIGVEAKNSLGQKYVKMCATNEEVDDLIKKGGKIVSVYSPLEGSEGFYKMDSINILESERGLSR